MYECFHCGHRSVIWDADFSFEDYCIEGEGIVHHCHCANCGAEIDYYIAIPEEDNNTNVGEDGTCKPVNIRSNEPKYDPSTVTISYGEPILNGRFSPSAVRHTVNGKEILTIVFDDPKQADEFVAHIESIIRLINEE